MSKRAEPIVTLPSDRPQGAASPRARGLPPRLPQGVRDWLPVAAAGRHRLVERLLDEAARWGYRRIETPPFEYEAVLARGLGKAAQAEAVRFVEAQTGEVVALRPDITPQVARLVATRFPPRAAPLRLSYAGMVVRRGTGHRYGGSDAQRVLDQVGVELVQAGAPSGDVEVVALAGAALRAAGLERFTIDLADASFVRAAFAGIPVEESAPLEQAVARKDAREVERLVAGLPLAPARRRLLVALPSLYGDAGVIDRARALVAALRRGAEQAQARAGLDALAELVERLVALDGGWRDRLSVDLGEVRGFDYYTGLRFQGYADGAGDAILSGGRYDGLLARYGRAAPAAGFAVDLERLARARAATGVVDADPAPAGALVVGEGGESARVAQALRRAELGAPVIEWVHEERGRSRLRSDGALVEQARALGLARVLVVDEAGAPRWHLVGREPLRGAKKGTPAGAPLDRKALARLVADPTTAGSRALARTLLGLPQLRRETAARTAGRARRRKVR